MEKRAESMIWLTPAPFLNSPWLKDADAASRGVDQLQLVKLARIIKVLATVITSSQEISVNVYIFNS